VKVYVTYYYFCGHLSEKLKVKLQRKECDLVEVVGGMTIHNIKHSMLRFLNHLMINEGKNARLGAN
jgi:hypothetical protein